MTKFDTHDFLANLGIDLVQAYDSMKQATTPGLVGEGRERSVRESLESILPGGVGVGTGCVIDSESNASDQIDLVLYENQLCPVFNVGGVCYYPCESVIAVGSIKSDIGKKELSSIYHNIESVRRLKKFVRPDQGKEQATGKLEFRRFLNTNSRVMHGDWNTIQNSQSSAQIYGFGFGQSFAAKPERMMYHTINLYRQVPAEFRPNVVLTINQEMLAPAKGNRMSYSPLGCSGVTFLKPKNSLEYLLVSLFSIIQNGITAPGKAFERYVVPCPMTRTHTFIPRRNVRINNFRDFSDQLCIHES